MMLAYSICNYEIKNPEGVVGRHRNFETGKSVSCSFAFPFFFCVSVLKGGWLIGKLIARTRPIQGYPVQTYHAAIA